MKAAASASGSLAMKSGTLNKRLFAVYFLSLLCGLIILHGENIIILNAPAAELMRFAVPVTLAAALVIAAALLVLSRWRLAPVYALLKEEPPETGVVLSLNRLYRWPYELLVGFNVFGLLLSIVFRAGYHFPGRIGVPPRIPQGQYLTGIIAGELSLTLTVSLFMFISVRGLLRPIIMNCQPRAGSLMHQSSVSQPLLITYSGTFMIALLDLFQLITAGGGGREAVDSRLFALTALFYFLIGLSLFGYVTRQFRRELRALVRSIRELVSGGREQLASTMPVFSRDEAGELAIAFNELQSRIDREYDSFERELKLAYNVQQKLLPPGDLTIGPYRIVARCQPNRGVGGDFFDAVSLSPNRFAVMIGDVTGKGVPAALIMSALMLLFRAEVRRCGIPSETLERLNRQLCEAMGEEGSVTIGVGVIDIVSGEGQYASAGHLSPYIVSAEGSVQALECGSLPIGMDEEAVYTQTAFALRPGDRMMLYTDGLIEARDRHNEMYSFGGLESELRSWTPGGDLPAKVDEWLHRMDENFGPGYDDRTVVVLERTVHAARHDELRERGRGADILSNSFNTREWSLPSRLGEERDAVFELGEWIESVWNDSAQKDDIQSAAAEAVVNAIEHGNRQKPGSRVALIAQIGSRLIVIKVYDEGTGYFPHVSRDEAEMAKKRESDDPRGWGLVLIDSLADYWATGHDERGFYTELYFMRRTSV